jgi:hypothetical protein
MSKPLSRVGLLVGCAALQAISGASSAVSPEAKAIKLAATEIVQSVEQSQALFGAKAGALSRLKALADEYLRDAQTTIHPCALFIAERFVRALPDNIPLPEFSAEPDGSISLDWIESRNRLFSVSVGVNNRFAFAWLDGTNSGYGVENFDGERVPKRLIDGIATIVQDANT